MQATNLDEYMTRYGALLGSQAAARINPLHMPGRDEPIRLELHRQPYEPQAHLITAGAKALKVNKSLLVVAECGTGKTLMGQAMSHAACHEAAGGRPYRAIVFCPPHLTGKWQRELEGTIPGVKVHQIESYRDVTKLRRSNLPTGAEWWVVSNNKAKMGPSWRPSFNVRRRKPGILFCPSCAAPIEEEDKEAGCMIPVDLEDLAKRRRYCNECGEALWTYRRDIDRWPVATYVHKKLKNFFRFLIVDEVHEEKGDDTAQANAMGSLAAAVPNCIALTGTLIGGYADHLRTLLFRLVPRTLVQEGFGWSDHMPFNERYGRIEKKVTTTEKKGRANCQSRGSQTRTIKYVRPGVMPSLFGRHLIGNTVFLSLSELSDNLPKLDERVTPVDMDAEMAEAYKVVEKALTDALKELVRKGNKRLLGTMLQTLLCYPDQPWGWGDIGYYGANDDGEQQWMHVVTPENLDPNKVRPKEAQLIADVKAEVAEGRQAWVFTTMTDKRDVCARLQRILNDSGIRTEVLRQKVEPKHREAWIAKAGPKFDCIISHPQLVQTGLDFFDSAGTFNYSTLLFYLTGYNLFTLRQASRRAWRLSQKLLCKVRYLYYRETMQERAMALMGKKLTAAEALEGKFSSEGLAAMAGDDGTMEMALARSLVERLDDTDAAREWSKVCKAAAAPIPPTVAMPPAAMSLADIQAGLARLMRNKAPRPTNQLSLFDAVA